jgi:hypothetical protein
MLVVEGWIGTLLLLGAWGFIATFVSLYFGYRRYVQQESAREKRCHHTLDVDDTGAVSRVVSWLCGRGGWRFEATSKSAHAANIVIKNCEQ